MSNGHKILLSVTLGVAITLFVLTGIKIYKMGNGTKKEQTTESNQPNVHNSPETDPPSSTERRQGEPANINRLNDIVNLSKSTKQRETEIDKLVGKVSKITMCGFDKYNCDRTRRTIAESEDVIQSLQELSKNMKIIVGGMGESALDTIYISTDGNLVITHRADLRAIGLYLGLIK